MDSLTRLALTARDGDREALAAFVERSQADVWRLCAHSVGRDHADDVCQDAFVRAIGALGRFRGESSARTWLLAIARRACADHVRRTIRRRSLLHRIGRQPTSPQPDAAAGVDLDVLLDGLDPDRRDAMVLTQVLGLSYEEAAEVCGCPVGTIRSRIARARAELIERLGSEDRATGS